MRGIKIIKIQTGALLVMAALFPPAALQAQSVTVDYGVLENLGAPPNVPSTLLGRPAPHYSASGARLSVPAPPLYAADGSGPKFPVIRNGRFTPPAGQIGLTAPPQRDMSLLSPPKPAQRVAPRRTARRAAPKPAPAPKSVMRAPVRKPAPIASKPPAAPKAPPPAPKKPVVAAVPAVPGIPTPTPPAIPTAPSIDSKPVPLPPPVVAATPKPAMAAPKPPTAKAPVSVASLPPAAPASPATGDQRRIGFAAGSAKLDSSGDTTLKSVAQQLKSDSALRVQLMAYAGTGGKSESQARRLSLSRALAVRSHLIGAGIKSTRIDVRALGSKAGDGPADRVDVIVRQR